MNRLSQTYRVSISLLIIGLSLTGAAVAQTPARIDPPATTLISPATTTTPAVPANTEDSLLEKYNRNVFGFNQGFDKTILKPTATFYNKALPQGVKTSVGNFFSNLNEIPTIINDILQTNFYSAVADSWRFAINSTVGLVGLFDVARHMGLQPHDEDFGLTLAQWGFKESPYFVIPFLGPSTIRDALGFPVNYYGFSVWPHIQSETTRNALLATNIVSKRASLLELNNVMQQAAFNPYIFEKNAYLQRRQYLIEENATPEELPDPSDYK